MSSTKAKSTPAPTGVLTEVGKAVRTLQAATTALAKVAGEFDVYTEKVVSLTDEIQEKEAKLASINSEMQEKVREAKVDTELAIKQNKLDAIIAAALSLDKVVADVDEYVKLQEMQENFSSNVAIEAKKGIAVAEAKFTNDLKVKDLEFKAKEAETQAKLSQLTDKVAFLTTQNQTLTKQIEQEREARIEIAKSQSQPVINVGKN